MRQSKIFLSISCVELVVQKAEGMVIGSTIGELVKLSFSDFHGKSNYGHLQISGVPNSRDHRLETTPPDDTIYSVSQSRWRPVAFRSRYFRQQSTNWKPRRTSFLIFRLSFPASNFKEKNFFILNLRFQFKSKRLLFREIYSP